LIKMDPKELRGLMEAYSEVYAPQEVDEAVKGESSERRSDLAAERRAGRRPKSAQEGERYASHKLSQMAYVKRQRMGEEVDIFDVVLEFLQAEGYVETLEEAEWLMANVIDEEAINIILGEEQLDELSDRKMRAYIKKSQKSAEDLNKKWDQGTATSREKSKVIGHEEGQRRAYKKLDKRSTNEEYMDEEQLDELSNKTVSNALNARIAATGSASDRAYKHRNPEAMRAAETAAGKEASMRSAVAKRRVRMNKEEFKLDEADSLAAMQARREKRQKANMKKHGTPGFDYSKPPSGKKGYLDAITKKEEYMDEAQVANRDPDKYEREQSKKSAPVRGERTPMPPRGDKRREDFEKWYAANVR
jgi:hypothetical protein